MKSINTQKNCNKELPIINNNFATFAKAKILFIFLIMFSFLQKSMATDFIETVYKTGVTNKTVSGYSVSPDGTKILFNTNQIVDGLQLLDLKSGEITKIQVESNRLWAQTGWSRDGTKVVATSVVIRNNGYMDGYMIDEQDVIILDTKDWSYRYLNIPQGANYAPIFSTDGKTLYYFRNIPRESGKTRSYDLYSYDLTVNKETKLTDYKMYQTDRAYDDGNEILFPAYGSKSLPAFKSKGSMFNYVNLYALNKSTLEVHMLSFDQSSGFFNIYFGSKDMDGNIYFRTNRNGKDGHCLSFIYRCDSNGNSCEAIRNISAESIIRIPFNTKEIFINDTMNNEIVFRKLVEIGD
jgi:Tol biopolymer transport system component